MNSSLDTSSKLRPGLSAVAALALVGAVFAFGDIGRADAESPAAQPPTTHAPTTQPPTPLAIASPTTLAPIVQAPSTTAAPKVTPTQFVTRVDRMYSRYLKDQESLEEQNELVLSYATSDLINRLVRQYAEFDKVPGSGSDLVLCAQNVPQKVTLSEAKVSGETISVKARMAFENDGYDVTVTGRVSDGLITDITCPSR